jgi:hypothetical protein
MSCLMSCSQKPIPSVNTSPTPDTTVVRTPQNRYSSTFDLSETSISEGGKWINGKTVGLDWTDVKTVGGVAKGNSNYPDWWRDSTALLKGTWGSEQTVQGTIWCQPTTRDESMEIEARLRSTLSANKSTGYEVTFNCNKTLKAYMLIVRWNGTQNDFTILKEIKGIDWGVKNGDVVKASIVGNVITAYINGVQKLQTNDDTFATGSPGIGFDHNMMGSNEDFGFTDISISTTGTELPKSPQK